MRNLITLVAAAVVATACGATPDYNLQTLRMPADIDMSANNGSETPIDADLQGDLPGVGEFDGAGYGTIGGWDDTVTLTVMSLDEDGWKMMGVDLRENADGDIEYVDAGNIGCAGSSEYNTDYMDEGSDETTIDAELVEVDGEEMVALEIFSDFGRQGATTGVAYIPVADQ